MHLKKQIPVTSGNVCRITGLFTLHIYKLMKTKAKVIKNSWQDSFFANRDKIFSAVKIVIRKLTFKEKLYH